MVYQYVFHLKDRRDAKVHQHLTASVLGSVASIAVSAPLDVRHRHRRRRRNEGFEQLKSNPGRIGRGSVGRWLAGDLCSLLLFFLGSSDDQDSHSESELRQHAGRHVRVPRAAQERGSDRALEGTHAKDSHGGRLTSRDTP